MELVCPVEYLNCGGHISIKKILTVMKRITKVKPDVLHAHMGGAAFAIPWGILHHKPVVLTVHTKPESAFSAKNEKLIRYGLKKKIVQIVAVSKENYSKVKQYFGIGSGQCTLINNGIEISRFYREPHHGFTFINVARQDENKNQGMLLNAFKAIHERNTDTKLLLIGDGPCHEQLIKMRDDSNLKDCVEIPGNTDAPEKYYAKADVYVQTSHREGMPLSILEAMAAGLPVISTNVGGIRDVIDANGILIDDNDEGSLIASMETMIVRSQNERTEMENRSLAIIKEYSSEKMAKEYADLYKGLCKRMRKSKNV